MKKIFLNGCAILFFVALSSCGINSSMIVNQNQINTQVQLANNNYKIIDRVSGSAEVKYILLVGGMDKTQLYENAYSAMINKANLKEGSKALVNIVTEEQWRGFPPFCYYRTITVSAHVIEFTK